MHVKQTKKAQKNTVQGVNAIIEKTTYVQQTPAALNRNALHLIMLRTTQREVSPGDGRDKHCTPYFQRSLVTIGVRCHEILVFTYERYRGSLPTIYLMAAQGTPTRRSSSLDTS